MNFLIGNDDQPAWYAGPIVAQTLGEQPTTTWLDLKPTKLDGTHVWSSSGGEEPKTG